MRAAYAGSSSADSPLSSLIVGERPAPGPREGWSTIKVRAAALNGHDLWALRGVGLSASSLPRILGSDAAGIDESGAGVVVYPVITPSGGPHAAGLEPVTGSLLSEDHDGTLAELVAVPTANLLPRPAHLSFAQCAALPTAWLTAYRMLFTLSGVSPGHTVLVQGAAGGVATALLSLGSAAGFRMWATSRTPEKRELAVALGAQRVFAPGERLPQRVDAVMETVGEATWDHSMKVLRPGGTIVVAGATSGHQPPVNLRRVFALGLRIQGTRMGTIDEFRELLRFITRMRITPTIDSIFPLDDAKSAFARLHSGMAMGKIIVTP